jgi:hypothetical protein
MEDMRRGALWGMFESNLFNNVLFFPLLYDMDAGRGKNSFQHHVFLEK